MEQSSSGWSSRLLIRESSWSNDLGDSCILRQLDNDYINGLLHSESKCRRWIGKVSYDNSCNNWIVNETIEQEGWLIDYDINVIHPFLFMIYSLILSSLYSTIRMYVLINRNYIFSISLLSVYYENSWTHCDSKYWSIWLIV